MIYYNEKVKEYAEELEKQNYRNFNLYTYGIDSDERFKNNIPLSKQQEDSIKQQNWFEKK